MECQIFIVKYVNQTVDFEEGGWSNLTRLFLFGTKAKVGYSG